MPAQTKPSRPLKPSATPPPPIPAAQTAAEARRVPWIAGALLLGTLLLFARAVPHDFVNYDDPDYVTANVHVRAGLTWDTVKWTFTSGEASNWHPLTWLSHALDVSIYGADSPRGHHFTSVLLHSLNAALAFLALRRLSGGLWASAFCAALFAWHPLRAESVAWVAERKDVLCAFFGFLVLWLYGGYVEHRRGGRRGPMGGAYVLMLGSFALGLLAKPMLVTLPCVLLLLDFWPLRRVHSVPVQRALYRLGRQPEPLASPVASGGDPGPAESLWFLIVEKVPLFLLVIGSSIATYLAQSGGGAVSSALPLDARLANGVVAVVRYLGKFFFPVDLAVLYPHSGHWSTGAIAAALVVVAAVTVLALWQASRRPWVVVGWLWFLGMLVPVSGLVQVGLQSMADRYTYLPILGVQVALIWTAREWFATAAGRIAGGWLATAVLAICVAATTRQLAAWENSGTLFTKALSATEKNFVAHDNRGLFYFKAGRIDEALADYRASLAINPAYLNANNNLGHALSELGRPQESVPLYRTALKAQPNHLEVRNNLANALSDLGELKEAMEHYEFVLARQPNHANALNGSAVVLAMQGNPAEAKVRLEKSIRLSPSVPSAYNNLGNVCSMLGDRDGALQNYRRALDLKPDDPHGNYVVGALLNERQRYAEALPLLQRSVTLRPNDPNALAHYGLALAQTGRRDEGIRALRAALQLQPSHAQATAWLRAAEGK